MTHNLSQLPVMIPDACPKCGQATRAWSIRRHIEQSHEDAIGTAVLRRDPNVARDFLFVAPETGGFGRWYVVWIDTPYDVATLSAESWTVQWRGTDPRVKESR